MNAPLTTSESKTLKEIRAAIKSATERGDHASLAAIKDSIVTMLDTASPALAAALKALPLVRAQYKAESDEALLQRLRDLGDEHGYGRATEDEESRGIEYVIETVQTPGAFAESFGTDEQRDFIADKLGTTAARLDRLDWYSAYGAGLVTGYHRRGEELAGPEVERVRVDSYGVHVSGYARSGDPEDWGRVVRMAESQLTGASEDEIRKNSAFELVLRFDGTLESDRENPDLLRESFRWSISGLKEIEYSENCDDITESNLKQAATAADEWPEYYRFEGGAALWFESDSRCAVVFNSDAVWTDAKSIEEGIGRAVLGQVIE